MPCWLECHTTTGHEIALKWRSLQAKLAELYQKPVVVSRSNELHTDRNKHKKLGIFF